MRQRLLWHSESDSYIIGDESAFDLEPLLIDVTGNHDHELNAELHNIDISGLTYTPYDRRLATGGMAGAFVKSQLRWKRKPADLYPTPPNCVYSLVPYVEDILPRGSVVLEPACADGKLSRALDECGYKTVSYELREDGGYGIGGVDFLDRENSPFKPRGYDAVWTNPPFSLAREFIDRALEIAPLAIMLVKSDYWCSKRRISLWRQQKPLRKYDLTWRPAFLLEERGASPMMTCSWLVFQRGHTGPAQFDILERIDKPPVDGGGL